MNQVKKDSSGLPLNKGTGIFGSQLSKGQNLFNLSTAVHVSAPLIAPTPIIFYEGIKAPKLFGNFGQFLS